MVRKSRRQGVVTVVLSLCMGLTGCLGVDSSEPPLQKSAYSGYVPPQRAAYSSNYRTAPKEGDIQQASYVMPAKAQFVGTVQPGQPAPPGQLGQPGEVIEQPMAGGPGPMMGPMGPLMPASPPMPTELQRVTHPPHRVAPPDVLWIESLRMIPKGPYRLEPMEVLGIEVTDTLPKQDIRGNYMITPEGTINLGFNYGTVRVGGLTVDGAQAAIRNHLGNILKNPTVNVVLVQMRGLQNVRGEHLVRPDGTINLGMYGSAYVAGMTLGQVKHVIETHLSAYLVNPQVAVDVFAYNSRKIYIVADGAGYGQQVVALPATGNETVLDAVSRVQGLPPVSSQKRIWVARPSPAGFPTSTVLPVDWKAIVQAGRTETNYQLLPGDRIYISSDPLICAYNYLDKFLAPIERIFSVTLLGSSTYQSLRGVNNGVLIAR